MMIILAPAPFATGGIERLSWSVYDALTEALGDRAVGMAALVGPPPHVPRASRGRIIYAGPPTLSLTAKLRYSREVILRLGRSAHATFFCMHINQSQLALVTKQAFGTPYVTWAHGSESWARVQLLPRWGLRRADLVLCSSNFTRDMVMSTHGVSPQRIEAIHPPISIECESRARLVKRMPSSSPPTIVSVGRLDPDSRYKGFDSVIRTLPLIVPSVPEVKYRVIGSGTGQAELASLANSLSVGDRVDLLGRLTDEELWQELESARVFAMPSRGTLEGRPEGEGLGIAALEAAAFGLPVVVGNFGGAPEAVIVGRTGMAVDGNDVASIANALLTYLTDEEATNKAGAAGRERVLAEFTQHLFHTRLISSLRQAGIIDAAKGKS
jgi:phosphatidylinositol alpha-1,6-mannosyltransferase